MNTKEKLAELTQLNPICFGHSSITALTGPDFGLRVDDSIQSSIGSVLNCDNANDMISIQKEHLKNSPHNIPLLFMADIIHGFKTIFPIPIALGCTFSPENAKKSSQVAAKESAVSGIHVTFSPMADLVRDPRWGRVMESTGEDPYLNSLMSAYSVLGYQGDNVADKYNIVSCVKHFAGYGVPEGGREYNTVELSNATLHDMFLPAYRSALEAGAKMIMTSFNTINRVPASSNSYLLQDLLRKEWGFDGVVISDFNSIDEVINHGVAQNGYEAAEKCLNASVDIEMMSTHYIDTIEQVINDGLLEENALDNAVMRVLELKNQLGLFENPYKDANIEEENTIHLCKEHRELARNIAHESAVLLKNDNVLPISNGKKIGLVGPFACSPHVLGGWSAGSTKGVSLYEGLLEEFAPEDILLSATDELGSMFDNIYDIPNISSNLIDDLHQCDTVIVALGENQQDTGEGASKTNLRLSPNQELLVKTLKESGKKIVTVIFSGRPLEIKPIVDYSDSILQAWFLGTESGNAITDLLLGKANPSAKLSMSFPVTVGQIPVYYNCTNTGRPKANTPKERYVSKYLDCPNEPLYPFGFGLSYSTFEISNLEISTVEKITASVCVKNTSTIKGNETVQLYIRDLTSSVSRPLKELKGFSKVTLDANESTTVSFDITKDMLSFYTETSKVFEKGYFDIMIGNSSDNLLQKNIYVDENIL